MVNIKGIPNQINAGDDYSIILNIPGYSAEEYSLNSVLVNKDTSIALSVTANANITSSFDLTISSSDTTDLTPGKYSIVCRVDNLETQQKTTVINQGIEVLPNLMSGSYDIRTTAQKLLEILDEALLKHGARAYSQSYSISGRNMSFTSHDEFMSFRNQIKAEAYRDSLKHQGKKQKNRLIVRV